MLGLILVIAMIGITLVLMTMQYVVLRYQNEHEFASNEIVYLSFILLFIGFLTNGACILQIYSLPEHVLNLSQAIFLLHILFKLVQYLILINRLSIDFIIEYSTNRLILLSVIATILSFLSIFLNTIDKFFGFLLIVIYDAIYGSVLCYFYFRPYYKITAMIKHRGDQKMAQILLSIARKQFILVLVIIFCSVFVTIYNFNASLISSTVCLNSNILISTFCVLQS